MLARLSRETKPYHALADNDRMALIGAGNAPATYVSFLARIFGFEAPIESALLMTSGLHEMIDLRDRSHVRLLRADLQALGVCDTSALPRCPMLFGFRSVAEALGWMYVVDRNMLVHAVVEKHLRGRMPAVLTVAGSYLSGQQRSTGQRLRDLGHAMDQIAKSSDEADRMVTAAKTAFRSQHSWYALEQRRALPRPEQHGG